MMKKINGLILILFLSLLTMPTVIAKNVAIKLADWDELGYKVRRTGEVNFTNGMRGDYVLLNHNESNVHAYVLFNKCPNGCGEFAKYNPDDWFSTIFMENIRPNIKTRLFNITTETVITNGHEVTLEEMRARFSDGFVEPDLISRVQLTGEQMLVVLMGMPHKGIYPEKNKSICPRFKPEFAMMKNRFSELMPHLLSDFTPQPKKEMNQLERLSRNFLRSGYQSDCWLKNIEF